MIARPRVGAGCVVALPLAIVALFACGDDDGPAGGLDGSTDSGVDGGSPDGTSPDGGTGDDVPPGAVVRIEAPDADVATDHLEPLLAPDYADDEWAGTAIPISLRRIGVALDPAATVGDVNALLESLDAVIVGAEPEVRFAILWLVGPTSLERVLAAAESARASGGVVVAAANDVQHAARALPPSDAVAPPASPPWNWDWPPDAESGSWGLRAIRVPPSWAWRVFGARMGRTVPIGQVEPRVPYTRHPALRGRVASTESPDDHATEVAGVMASAWDSVPGSAGVLPYGGGPFVRSRSSSGFTSTAQAYVRLALDGARVINESAGPVVPGDPLVETSPGSGVTFRLLMNDEGTVIAHVLDPLDVLAFCAAGNWEYAPGTFDPLQARDAGECENAAHRTVFGDPPLLVGLGQFLSVEATDAMGRRATWDLSHNSGSTRLGTLSAPGTCVVAPSTTGDDSSGCAFGDSRELASVDGTSFASPMAAGVAAYLWSLAPELTRQQVYDLITDLAHRVPQGNDGAARIDAFAAILGIDQMRGDTRMQVALVDVDDGTPDGNERVALQNDGTPVPGENTSFSATDHQRGDGVVTMADFRALRDALVAFGLDSGALGPADAVLDGSPRNPKRDLNEDGCIDGSTIASLPGCDLSPPEHVHSRFDFNGDGVLGVDPISTTSPVWGSLGPVLPFLGHARSPDATDADVLAGVWPDGDATATEGWASTDLASLLPIVGGGSADLHLRSTRPLGTTEPLDRVEVSFDSVSSVRSLVSSSEVLFTVPLSVDFDRIHMRGFSGGTERFEVCFDGRTDRLLHGEDRVLVANAARRIRLRPTTARVVTGETSTFTARPCGVERDVTWTATGGTIDATGVYTAGSVPGMYEVRATSREDPMVFETAMVRVVPAIELQLAAPEGCLRGGDSVPVAARLLRRGDSFPDQLVDVSLRGSGSLSLPQLVTDALGSGTVTFTAPAVGRGSTTVVATYVEPMSMAPFMASDIIDWDEAGTCACPAAPCVGECGLALDGCGGTKASCGDTFAGVVVLSAASVECCTTAGGCGPMPGTATMTVTAVAGAAGDMLALGANRCTGNVCGDSATGSASCAAGAIGADWTPTTVRIGWAPMPGYTCTAMGAR